ncbi:MAG: RDD family protein [Acidobacteria bacterium]|nr:RDD family protein [Acidobacteriota bacterium]MSO61099.1 RDD family protein [Acidobacteriota bacterium]
MKCPKCGYLGFETTDRCRNCQYDFSLSPFSAQPDLTLRQDSGTDSMGDFELPAITRPADNLTAESLDLDRLFGDPGTEKGEPARATPAAVAARRSTPGEPDPLPAVDHEPPVGTVMSLAAEADEAAASRFSDVSVAAEIESPVDPNALPFDDAPMVPPRAARTPLAVRRATPEIPRNRPRTTRPVRMETPLAFELAPAVLRSSEASTLASETVASLMPAPALGVRVAAGVIDLALLAGIAAAVLFLTLRIAGLQTTVADLRLIPVVPFAGFLTLLAFGYVASFTVAGGQTIGKMLLKLRVIGDDGRPIDAAGGVLRAVGCMLVPATLGLSYVPALFSSDHRALHDRLAGTRVVSE